MAHQVCVTHGKRSVVTKTALIHRNGDGKKCNSDTVVCGKFSFLVRDLQSKMIEDPAVNLLRKIFSNEDEINAIEIYEEEMYTSFMQ